MKQLMITAMESGAGKTLVTCALLKALKDRNQSPESLKCGPDYIDPMFHRKVLGIPADNADIFLQGEMRARQMLGGRHAGSRVIEGAMGYYDGRGGTTEGSAWHLASIGHIPALLVVRPRGSSISLAAQIRGMLGFRQPSLICGILLNDCKESLYRHLRPILESETGLPVVGYLPHMEEAVFESRHLGLVTVDEIDDFAVRIGKAARMLEECADLEMLMGLAGDVPENDGCPAGKERSSVTGQAGARDKGACTIAVARDEAFCFYYESSLQALRSEGADLVFFSPLRDQCLPEADALYLGGGYPELYARRLSENVSMRESIRRALLRKMPVIAECGGFVYLQKSLEDLHGKTWPMAGYLDGEAFRTDGLVRFGYLTLHADEDSMLFKKGESIPAHEFHHWDSTKNGESCLAEKASGRKWRFGHLTDHMYAAFPHLHLAGEQPLAQRFVEAAVHFSKERDGQCDSRRAMRENDGEFLKERDGQRSTLREIWDNDGEFSEERDGQHDPRRIMREDDGEFSKEGDARHAALGETPKNDDEASLRKWIAQIGPSDQTAMEQAERHWDSLAKPLGGLGLLEKMIVKIAGIQGTRDVRIDRRELLVLCADNGVVKQGVSQTDSSVTAAVARALASGTSTASYMAEKAGCRIYPVNIGIHDYENAAGTAAANSHKNTSGTAGVNHNKKSAVTPSHLHSCCVKPGTDDITEGPAMTREECVRAILLGMKLVKERKEAGVSILLAGEMGIGNTTTTSAVAGVLLGRDPEEMVGRGAGLSDEGMMRKLRAVRKAIAHNQPDPSDVIDVLAKVGGLDLAGLCGVCLGGALFGVPVLLDGVITLTAALCSVRLCPDSRKALLLSHESAEPPTRWLMKEMNLDALIKGGLRLGEGTGALLALPLLDQALAVYRSGHTFSHLGIEPYRKLS